MDNPNRVQMEGTLAAYKDGLIADLRAQGYTRMSTTCLVRLMAHLSNWLSRRDLQPIGLTPDVLGGFLRHRMAHGHRSGCTFGSMKPILSYLRREGIVPIEARKVPQRTPLDELLGRYEEYLVRERSLVASTVYQHRRIAGHFLSTIFKGRAPDPARLESADVSSYMLGEARTSSVACAKFKATALRSFLRYLHVGGIIPMNLSGAIPAIASWQLTGLPQALNSEQASRLLNAPDRRTSVGRRDYAVLILMLRLGLRAGEVAALSLDDIDWAQGELMVHGKNGRVDSLPIPQDVGAAITSYLRGGRPSSKSRRLFLSAKAPLRDLTGCAVKHIVSHVGKRCGFPCLGAHRLRHTCATQMLRKGASLPEIGQVLRHRYIDTTAIYAKVDHGSLRMACRPWPGARP